MNADLLIRSFISSAPQLLTFTQPVYLNKSGDVNQSRSPSGTEIGLWTSTVVKSVSDKWAFMCMCDVLK